MKRTVLFLLAAACILAFSACGSKDAVPQTAADQQQSSDSSTDTDADENKSWSEQDIAAMFSLVQEAGWQYTDCVVIPDRAGGRVGAVLFRDDEKQSSNVAFFAADGSYQQCGTSAALAAEPDFTYLGNGAVTFKLETAEGTVYNYTLTISISGSAVNFTAEDDLARQQ